MSEFRDPKKGDLVSYDCGCEYEVSNVRKEILVGNWHLMWDIEPNFFCEEHDPTLSENYPDGE